MHIGIYDIAEALTMHSVIAQGTDFFDGEVQGFSWDSRTIKPQDIFFAISGARSDGHDFIPQALDAGATLIIGTNEEVLRTHAAAHPKCTFMCVSAIDVAIQKIAHLWYTKLSTISIGITGSVGKTTTRSLVAAVLSRKYRVHATEGNFNNELGLPATVLNAPEDTEALVLEMGMDGAGQIRDLCRVVPVQCGIITTIGTSHMLQLGSQENIARAKAEIFEHMRTGDCAIVPKNDEYVSIIEESAHLADNNVTTYYFAGTDVYPSREAIRKPHVWASDIALNKDGFPACTIHVAMGEAENALLCGTLTLSLRGEHNISNACAAIAAGLHFGVDLFDCLDAVSAVGAQDGRQKMYTNAHGISVIDDSYNASPESMIASLRMFSALETSGLRIAILGDMGELGELSQQGHTQVAREVGVLYANTKISKIIFVGSQSEYMKDIAGIPEKDCYTAKDAHMAADIALDILQQGDVVLVKASHFMNMHDIVERILQA